MSKPLCFVLMPFGEKPDTSGQGVIDFNRIYEQAIKPGIEDAGMDPIRADEERTGGIIHKPMFERLLLCDYAVADLTTANANVFYELGVRHTARPATTLTIFAQHQKIPFDVQFLRSLPYELGENLVFGDGEATALRASIASRLSEFRLQNHSHVPVDSPVFQLLGEWQAGDLARLKTDSFRDRVQLNEAWKSRCADIRAKAKLGRKTEATMEMAECRKELGSLDAVEAGTVIDFFLTYRALSDWDGMIQMVEAMPETLKRQILVQEQLGFAYNRRAGKSQNPADRAQAQRILEAVEARQGPSSETCGLIGRIYKDLWQEALKANRNQEAVGQLNKATAAYLRGYKADFRDPYSGINALTLLDVRGDEDALKEKDRLLPVVRFAVESRMSDHPDYWDHATLLELAVLENNWPAAETHLANALAGVREPWEPETTANNLKMIQSARMARFLDIDPILSIIEALNPKGNDNE